MVQTVGICVSYTKLRLRAPEDEDPEMKVDPPHDRRAL